MEITPEQIRAARALLGLDQAELAERAHISAVTIGRLERAKSVLQVSPATLQEVRRALEEAGAEFIADGVRKRPAVRADAEARYQRLRAISLKSAAELAGHELLTDDDIYDENGLPW